MVFADSEVLSKGAGHAETEGFVVLYTVVFAMASLVSLFSLLMKSLLYIEQVRKRQYAASSKWISTSWLVYVNVLLMCFEDIPMVYRIFTSTA